MLPPSASHSVHLLRSIGALLGRTHWPSVTVSRSKFKRVTERPIGQRIEILAKSYLADEWTNVPDKVVGLVGRNLYATPGNPIYLVAESLRRHFHDFHCHTFADPVVDLWANFDSILVPPDHISRSRTDTFYVDRDHVLRSHTSAHQSVCFRQCTHSDRKFLILGDVYRRDEVNRTHHAAFHQCELAQLFGPEDPCIAQAGLKSLFDPSQARSKVCQEGLSQDAVRVVERHLKESVEAYVRRLFGPGVALRWVEAVFPFTHPSWELEIQFAREADDQDKEEWLEMLGCGIVEQDILRRDSQGHRIGWAAGVGLERLAMLYYGVPDIRLFWTRDTGFLVQFSQLEPFERVQYRPISAFPQRIFDLSFWLPEAGNEHWSANDVHAIVLEVGGDLVEQVCLADDWTRPSDGRRSNTYRIVYRSHERALTGPELNSVHGRIEEALVRQLKVSMR